MKPPLFLFVRRFFYLVFIDCLTIPAYFCSLKTINSVTMEALELQTLFNNYHRKIAKIVSILKAGACQILSF